MAEIAGGPIALIAFSYIGTESELLAVLAGLGDGPHLPSWR